MIVFGVFADVQVVQGNAHAYSWELVSLHSSREGAEEAVKTLQKEGFPWKLEIREQEVL